MSDRVHFLVMILQRADLFVYSYHYQAETITVVSESQWTATAPAVECILFVICQTVDLLHFNAELSFSIKYLDTPVLRIDYSKVI